MKNLLLLLLLNCISLNTLFSQNPPNNWFLLDPKTDGVFGVSAEKAHEELLKGKTATTVVVAVLDIGVDAEHEDLKNIMFVNPKEIAGNKIDDDKNGYIDDIHGWNFLGGPNGNVQYDNMELTRIYKKLSDKYATATTDSSDFTYYLFIKMKFDEKAGEVLSNYKRYNTFLNKFNALIALTGTPDPTKEQIEQLDNLPDSLMNTKASAIRIMSEGNTAAELQEDIKRAVDAMKADAEFRYNTEYDPRTIVGDNYADANERYYGNNNIAASDPTHGTHVAGIIAADRNNNMGVKGVADHVKILALRCVPDGDERDKDVANSIRYATDMGAKVINMSFGKPYSWNKKVVDDAIKYAASKDVLIVHGSGNDNLNVDVESVFPNKYYEDGGEAANFINVGACRWDNDVAGFSNYGKNGVDIWAPGVRIYSTVPGNGYRNLQGTSMASPVVAGVASVIRSYYPSLTAVEVKDILMKSVVKMKKKVILPGSDDQKVKLKKISVSGGVVNCYKAVQLAEKRVK